MPKIDKSGLFTIEFIEQKDMLPYSSLFLATLRFEAVNVETRILRTVLKFVFAEVNVDYEGDGKFLVTHLTPKVEDQSSFLENMAEKTIDVMKINIPYWGKQSPKISWLEDSPPHD